MNVGQKKALRISMISMHYIERQICMSLSTENMNMLWDKYVKEIK